MSTSPPASDPTAAADPTAADPTVADPAVAAAGQRLRAAMAAAGAGLIEREGLVELIVLAAVAGEHLLVIGPPGTAKSEAVRRVSRQLGGTYFEYLLGRFTEPGELFGPVDLRRLREGEVVVATEGMLPEAEIAFLDEVFLGSTAILNTLLGVLMDRRFRRGRTDMACPLRVCVGASNGLPDDPALDAFADRFLLRTFVDSLPDPRLEELLEGGWGLGAGGATEAAASVADLDVLHRAARAMRLDAVRSPLAHAIRALRKAGIRLSDRRAVKVQKLVAAAAALAGRSEASEADLWPIVYAVPTDEEQLLARDALRELLDRSENGTLGSAAEAASHGPLVRAQRLVATARDVLAGRPVAHDEGADGAAARRVGGWQLKVEGVVREMDAAFAVDQRPSELEAARAELVAVLDTVLDPVRDDAAAEVHQQ